MKYSDENIPFDKCVKVLGLNSSRFDIALLSVALDCELWTVVVPIGDLINTKSITVTHKKSHMKLQFIDTENLFESMTLKACIKDYGDKSEHKDVFPYEDINSKNWKEILVKTEPFEYENFRDDASCAYATKHYSTYFPSNFNLEVDKQDYKAGRETEKNVTADDYDYYKNLFSTSVCSICNAKFTYDNLPSLDKQNNELPHTKDNCLPACVSCNIAHANRDPKIASLHIKMRQCAIKHNLSMIIRDERIYKLLRECITGGLAAVFHRENIAGKTNTNELTYDEQSNKVILQDNENVTTHAFAPDDSSLYPNSYSSVKNENIPYTDHRMYMAGRSRFYSEKLYVIKNCIDQRKDIFVAKVKGCFPKSEYNNLLALPLIFRNIEIENKKEVIGEYIYSQAQKHSLPTTMKDRKLTILVDTNGQFMVFNNYYLWLLIDLGFIITDNKAIAVFEKNTAYEPFVRTMMNLRIQAILAGSSKEKFYKLLIKASYGYNTLNTEKFSKIKLLDKADTFIAQHHPNHIDTDSVYIAIAGDPNKHCHQQFESIVTDKQFYDQHVYQYLPDPQKDIYDYKKILRFGIENQGYDLTSLGPKCYSMIVLCWDKLLLMQLIIQIIVRSYVINPRYALN
ncbi:MAG: hypothetical protein EZS28_005475 [Streblomastix strix]|uniref:Uncharacterized protein n=1 Tax=Streblomastix strix TaxID=222440 RepID=A0A5J4WVZ5_9EUKA|nr:MAG: hypothetical protein EZS28_005475 [Streblomastix strix]